MSLWVTEETMRWSLSFCSRKFLWKQHCFRASASINNAYFSTRQPVLLWNSKQNQKCLSRRIISSKRLYSEDRDHDKKLKESGDLSSQLVERSPPAEVHQNQRISPFWSHLQQCLSPSDVLDLTCKYSHTVRQTSNCLTQMWFSTKKMSEEQCRYELQLMFEHPEFDKFLQKAMKSVQHMRNDDIAYSLLSMVNLGVPQRSRVIQTFLRACQEKLNEFDEKTLSILASCLEHMEESPNVDALKEGMRLVVEARLPGIKNVMALQTLMRILGKDSPKDLKRKLERKALLMTDQFTLPNAQHMISTMATMGFYSKPLLDVCSKKITEDLHGIPFNRLYSVLQSSKELLYRDLDMLTGISDYVASTRDVWTNKQLLLFLSVFEALVFCPSALMETYADKFIENPDALTLKDLLCVLKVYSSFNYDLGHKREQFLDSLSCTLGSYLPKMSGLELLKATYCLCLLNHVPSPLVEQLLQSNVLEQLQTTKHLTNRKMMFRTVDLCLRLDRPLPRRLTVPTSVLGDVTPSSQTPNPQLSQSLQSLLTSQTNAVLQEMVVVENFYVLDGVVTKMLPVHSCVTETSCASEEQRSPAESSQRIAVIYAPRCSFCHGTSKPRGALAVKIRHLKILGYAPVLVTEKDLQSEERTDILRRLIFPEHTSEIRPNVGHLGL